MKKFLLFLFVTFVFIPLRAQLTLVKSDVLITGTHAMVAYDTSHPSLNLGFPGFGQVWDFTSLVAHETNSISIVKPDGMPGFDHFPSATAVVVEDSGWQFFRHTNSVLELLGVAAIDSVGDTVTTPLNLKVILFPSIINTTLSDQSQPFYFQFEIGVDPDGPGPHPYIDSLGLRSYTTIISKMDAQGFLETSFGNNEVLRQYIQSITRDSVFMYVNGKWEVISDFVAQNFAIDSVTIDTSHAYRFLAKEASFPLAEVEFDIITGDILSAQWASEISIGMNMLQHETTWKALPNPADQYVLFDGPEEVTRAIITDVAGKTSMHSVQNNRLNTAQLASGTYVLKPVFVNEAIGRGRLIQVIH